MRTHHRQARRQPRQARNSPCACGSGKKYKRCHYLIEHTTIEAQLAEVRERAQWLRERERESREERLASYGRDDNDRHGNALVTGALIVPALGNR